jgi:hypothetical protein
MYKPKNVVHASNCYTPSRTLENYFEQRLQLEHLGADDTNAVSRNKKIREMNRMKVHILNKIVFPSMANIVYFLETVSKNPELQQVFDDDLKELFGIRYPLEFKDKSYSPIIRRLVEAMIFWTEGKNEIAAERQERLNEIAAERQELINESADESEKRLKTLDDESQNLIKEISDELQERQKCRNSNFRLALLEMMQRAIFYRMIILSTDEIGGEMANFVVKNDIGRAWSWAKLFAKSVEWDAGEPRRTPNF